MEYNFWKSTAFGLSCLLLGGAIVYYGWIYKAKSKQEIINKMWEYEKQTYITHMRFFYHPDEWYMIDDLLAGIETLSDLKEANVKLKKRAAKQLR